MSSTGKKGASLRSRNQDAGRVNAVFLDEIGTTRAKLELKCVHALAQDVYIVHKAGASKKLPVPAKAHTPLSEDRSTWDKQVL